MEAEINYDKSLGDFFAWLKAAPDIPEGKDYWGKTYHSTCTCGGRITAVRELNNGHLRIKCDRCNMKLIE